jgi:hypothetical protein
MKMIFVRGYPYISIHVEQVPLELIFHHPVHQMNQHNFFLDKHRRWILFGCEANPIKGSATRFLLDRSNCFQIAFADLKSYKDILNASGNYVSSLIKEFSDSSSSASIKFKWVLSSFESSHLLFNKPYMTDFTKTRIEKNTLMGSRMQKYVIPIEFLSWEHPLYPYKDTHSNALLHQRWVHVWKEDAEHSKSYEYPLNENPQKALWNLYWLARLLYMGEMLQQELGALDEQFKRWFIHCSSIKNWSEKDDHLFCDSFLDLQTMEATRLYMGFDYSIFGGLFLYCVLTVARRHPSLMDQSIIKKVNRMIKLLLTRKDWWNGLTWNGGTEASLSLERGIEMPGMMQFAYWSALMCINMFNESGIEHDLNRGELMLAWIKEIESAQGFFVSDTHIRGRLLNNGYESSSWKGSSLSDLVSSNLLPFHHTSWLLLKPDKMQQLSPLMDYSVFFANDDEGVLRCLSSLDSEKWLKRHMVLKSELLFQRLCWKHKT